MTSTTARCLTRDCPNTIDVTRSLALYCPTCKAERLVTTTSSGWTYAARTMADSTTGRADNMLAHAGHNFEEWHAYLSCDDEMPEWITGDDSGICCHDCSTIVVDQA